VANVAGSSAPLSRQEELHRGHRRSRTAGCPPRGPKRSAYPAPLTLLLCPSLRPHVAGVEPVVPLRVRRRTPAFRRGRDVGLPEYRRPDTGTYPLRVHHDGRDRRQGRRTPAAASDRAVAGGLWVVFVCPLGHTRARSALHGSSAWGPDFAMRRQFRQRCSCTWWLAPFFCLSGDRCSRR
jgi:hypothetical protein